ncbi:MAG TPA: PIN domain-containing protein [Polyangia bacterium]|jgi:predicted nucleic-acid-binding protein|nr:PIN domain-containing protein [Polyangia bacterium]
MRAADTNVVVRLIVGDDRAQMAMAERHLTAGLWVSHVVLVGVAWVLGSPKYNKTSIETATALEMLLDNPSFTIESPDVVRAAITLLKTSKAIDLADAMIVEIARKAGMGPLLTFDVALSKVDGAEFIKKAKGHGP